MCPLIILSDEMYVYASTRNPDTFSEQVQLPGVFSFLNNNVLFSCNVIQE